MDKQRLIEQLKMHVLDLRPVKVKVGYIESTVLVPKDKMQEAAQPGAIVLGVELPDLLTWAGAGAVVAAMGEKGRSFNLTQVGPVFTATFTRTLGPTMSESFSHVDQEAPVATGTSAIKALKVEVE